MFQHLMFHAMCVLSIGLRMLSVPDMCPIEFNIKFLHLTDKYIL